MQSVIYSTSDNGSTWSKVGDYLETPTGSFYVTHIVLHNNYYLAGCNLTNAHNSTPSGKWFLLENEDNTYSAVSPEETSAKTELTNAGISNDNITAIENAVVTNNSTVTVLKDKGLDTTEKRAAAIRLIFAKNATITKFKTKGKDMNMGRRLNKENYTVYKKGSTVTLTDDVAEDNGVYSDISETGDTVTFKKDANGQEITFTKVEGGYTATGSTKTWKAGQRYTVDGVSYYFD